MTFARGDYYEYSLVMVDGAYRVTRRLRNRYGTANEAEAEAEAVETPEAVEACRQAFVYNFPHAFNIDGSVAIDLPPVPEILQVPEQEQEQELERDGEQPDGQAGTETAEAE